MRQKFLTSLLVSALLVWPLVAQAGPLDEARDKLKDAVGGPEISFESRLETSVGTVVAAALSLVGTIFLLLTIYAGILWMTAQGKEDQIEKAKKIITAAIIGLFITMAAYAITAFVTGRLQGVGGGGGGGGGAPGGGGTPAPGGIINQVTCQAAGGWCMDQGLSNGQGSYEPSKYDTNNPCDPNGIDPFVNNKLGSCGKAVCCELKDSILKCQEKGGRCQKSCGPADTVINVKCDGPDSACCKPK